MLRVEPQVAVVEPRSTQVRPTIRHSRYFPCEAYMTTSQSPRETSHGRDSADNGKPLSVTHTADTQSLGSHTTENVAAFTGS